MTSQSFVLLFLAGKIRQRGISAEIGISVLRKIMMNVHHKRPFVEKFNNQVLEDGFNTSRMERNSPQIQCEAFLFLEKQDELDTSSGRIDRCHGR